MPPIVYSIFWILLILAIIVAIPVVNAMEKKKRLAAMPAEPDDAFADQDAESDESAEDAFGDSQEEPEFAAVDDPAGEPAGDDFAAFDEEFK